MGRTTRPRPGLADALFTPVQQRVLALLYGQPDRVYQSGALIRLARGGVGAVHRQLARLTAAGLVRVTQTGNQKHYQANHNNPVFHELHGLITKTVGVAEPIRQALANRAEDIQAAFIYGSVAKGTDRSASDIDVMVISDTLTHADLYEALGPVESTLGRRINPTVMTSKSWRTKRQRSSSFAARVDSGPRVFIIGSDDALP